MLTAEIVEQALLELHKPENQITIVGRSAHQLRHVMLEILKFVPQDSIVQKTMWRVELRNLSVLRFMLVDNERDLDLRTRGFKGTIIRL